MLSPLKEIFKTPLKKSERLVFIITDGCVEQERDVLSLIKENKTATRLFVVGIGSSVNPEQIRSMARLGKGAHEFVQLDEVFEKKIIQLLKRSFLTMVFLFKSFYFQFLY